MRSYLPSESGIDHALFKESDAELPLWWTFHQMDGTDALFIYHKSQMWRAPYHIPDFIVYQCKKYRRGVEEQVPTDRAQWYTLMMRYHYVEDVPSII